MEIKLGNAILKLLKGDITDLKVDAIVNAANSSLIMGGGVAGAIRKRGGEEIQKECLASGYTPVGQAVITGAGKLQAKYVIHAVGPRWGEGEEKEKLASAVISTLKLANQHKLTSIALPAISTGIFGFPKQEAAKIILKTLKDYLEKENKTLKEVIICLFDKESFDLFCKVAKEELI